MDPRSGSELSSAGAGLYDASRRIYLRPAFVLRAARFLTCNMHHAPVVAQAEHAAIVAHQEVGRHGRPRYRHWEAHYSRMRRIAIERAGLASRSHSPPR